MLSEIEVIILSMDLQFIFSLIILLFSVIIHEISHGYAALIMGDKTAEYEGRLTLNPIPHIDLVGTILFPAISLMLPGSLLFGWAKPVPFNPYNLRNQKWGEAFVAVAGPLSNILIAVVFGLFIRFYIVPNGMIESPVALISYIIVLLNITLAVFNLVPVPPLDGSKIISAILPRQWMKVRGFIEKFGFVGVILFLIFIWQFFEPVIPWLFSLITGLSV
jgi:Zn-dependent protease